MKYGRLDIPIPAMVDEEMSKIIDLDLFYQSVASGAFVAHPNETPDATRLAVQAKFTDPKTGKARTLYEKIDVSSDEAADVIKAATAVVGMIQKSGIEDANTSVDPFTFSRIFISMRREVLRVNTELGIGELGDTEDENA